MSTCLLVARQNTSKTLRPTGSTEIAKISLALSEKTLRSRHDQRVLKYTDLGMDMSIQIKVSCAEMQISRHAIANTSYRNDA